MQYMQKRKKNLDYCGMNTQYLISFFDRSLKSQNCQQLIGFWFFVSSVKAGWRHDQAFHWIFIWTAFLSKGFWWGMRHQQVIGNESTWSTDQAPALDDLNLKSVPTCSFQTPEANHVNMECSTMHMEPTIIAYMTVYDKLIKEYSLWETQASMEKTFTSSLASSTAQGTKSYQHRIHDQITTSHNSLRKENRQNKGL